MRTAFTTLWRGIRPNPDPWSEGRPLGRELWPYPGLAGCTTDTPGKQPPERVFPTRAFPLEPYRIALFRYAPSELGSSKRVGSETRTVGPVGRTGIDKLASVESHAILATDRQSTKHA